MKLNARGEFVAGIGSLVVSLNRQPMADQAGIGGFLDDDRILYARCDAGTCGIFSQNQGNIRSESSAGANHLVAGGGKWAAYLAQPPVGVPRFRGNFGDLDRLVIDIAPDGAVLQKRDDAGGLVLDGEIISEAGGIDDPQVLDRAHVLYRIDRTISFYSWGVTTQIPSYAIDWFGWLRGAFVHDMLWIGYADYSRVAYVAHPALNPFGYVVSTGEATYRPDMRHVDDRLRVVYAVTEGEAPTDLRVYDLDLAAPRIDLRAVVGPPVPVPPPTPIPPPVPIPVPIPAPGPFPSPIPMPNPNESREQAEKRLACLIIFGQSSLGKSALIEAKQSAHELFDGLDHKTTDEYDVLMAHCIRKGLA